MISLNDPKIINELPEYLPWNKKELCCFRKHLLAFGYGRWSRIRCQSKHGGVDDKNIGDGLLSDKSDDEMRPYANWLIIKLL